MPDDTEIETTENTTTTEAESSTTEATLAGHPGRRSFLAFGGAVGAGLVATRLAGCGDDHSEGGAVVEAVEGVVENVVEAAHGPASAAHVAPGTLDEYYGFWSGGQSGEIRLFGVPSMRELKRIPVFNFDAATGHAKTDWSQELLKGRISGDTHHVHLSYTDGTYDGRYVYVNDKASARLARVRLDTMELDAVVHIPNANGTHGIFPQRHRTGLVFCNSEFRTPMPNNGQDMDDPSKYAAMHTAINGETMEVEWQVMVEGNMDLCATDYEGKYSMATCYNSEGGVTLEEMMGAERDHLYVFNLEAIQAAVDAGNTMTVGDSPVPVVDARGDNSQFVLRIPISKSPHGVNMDPTGRYAMCAGKLSPTVSIVQMDKIAAAFAGDIEPRDCVVGEPEVGLGPLHTAFDNEGNAYTSIFIDSVVTKWNIADAIAAYGTEEAAPIAQKIDVHYQIGHINGSMSETKDADGQWIVALCKFSKDRFLPVGPLMPENDQLISLAGGEMTLVHDGPTFSEPHDCVIVTKDLIHPVSIQPRTHPRFAMYDTMAAEDNISLQADTRVVRRPGLVRVYMTSQAPNFGKFAVMGPNGEPEVDEDGNPVLSNSFRVKAGDKVQIIVSNQDNVEDLSHGMCVTHHDVNFLVNAQDTNSMTFTAGSPGVYWYYCPWFCHALHLEMRGRMIVEPA